MTSRSSTDQGATTSSHATLRSSSGEVTTGASTSSTKMDWTQEVELSHASSTVYVLCKRNEPGQYTSVVSVAQDKVVSLHASSHTKASKAQGGTSLGSPTRRSSGGVTMTGATVSTWKMNWNQGLVSLPHTSLACRVRRTMNSAGQGPVRVSSASVHVKSLKSLASGRLSENGTSQGVSTSCGQSNTEGA